MCRSSVLVLILGLFVLGAGCASDEEAPTKKDYSRALRDGESALELVTDPRDLPDFRAVFVDRESSLRALDQSLLWFSKPSSEKHYPFESFTHDRVVASLETLRDLLTRSESAEEFSGRARRAFDVYRSVGWNGDGEVLFTAYYQPIFDGSRTATSRFRHPLYRLPSDLVKAEDGTPLGRRVGESIVTYPTRREIEEGRLFEGQGLELIFVENELDAFIIHVQGSAKIRLEDGQFAYVGYAGKTDRAYTSIGQELVADGEIASEDLSLAAIRDFFARHPERLTEYLRRNESFVFFTETDAGGPFGSLGVPVTAWRTLATDKSIFPRGSPCIVSTPMPSLSDDGRLTTQQRTALAFDQDTGGAIRSPGRCDVFVGTGPDAERIAGHTKHEGRLFYLFVKSTP